MERLRHDDLLRVTRFLGEGLQVVGLDEFARYMLRALPQVVPCFLIRYSDLNPDAGRITRTTEPDQATRFSGAEDAFRRHINEHPLVRHAAMNPDTGWLRVSDFLTRTSFRKTSLYHEYYRRVGVEYQIAVILRRSSSSVMAISMNRNDRDFSDRERGILNAIWPHLRQAYSTAERYSRVEGDARLIASGLDFLPVGIVALTRNVRIRFATTAAHSYLTSYFGRMPSGDQLPRELTGWLSVQRGLINQSDPFPAEEPFLVDLAGRRLSVRLVHNDAEDMLLLEEQITEVTPESLRSLGLPSRQTEVLSWVAQGKTTPEIAVIMGLSPRTVHHHLEHIFQTLGVETRTAAAMRAMEAAKTLP